MTKWYPKIWKQIWDHRTAGMGLVQIIYSNLLLGAQHLCPGGFLRSPVMETSKLLWTICASARPPAWWKWLLLCLNGTFISICASCPSIGQEPGSILIAPSCKILMDTVEIPLSFSSPGWSAPTLLNSPPRKSSPVFVAFFQCIPVCRHTSSGSANRISKCA